MVACCTSLYVAVSHGAPPQKVQAEFLSRFVTTESVAWHPDGQRISLWVSPEWVSREFWTVPVANGSPLKSEVRERCAASFRRLPLSSLISGGRRQAGSFTLKGSLGVFAISGE